jgi:hypothetical protein
VRCRVFPGAEVVEVRSNKDLSGKEATRVWGGAMASATPPRGVTGGRGAPRKRRPLPIQPAVGPVEKSGEESAVSDENCSVCGGVLTTPDHDHRQAPVEVHGLHAHVDENLVDLIAACWRVGIATTSSCQEDPEDGLAAIGFGPGAAELFVGAATTKDLDDPATFESLGWRMRGTESIDSWTWQPGGFAWRVSFVAFFPPADIGELTTRLRKFFE